jgi:hypothetical protein
MWCGVHPFQRAGQSGVRRGPCSCDLNDSSWVCKGTQRCLDEQNYKSSSKKTMQHNEIGLFTQYNELEMTHGR